MSSLNPQIKAAIDSFDTSHARELLRDAMKEADAETFYLASRVALDDDQKQEFLEKAVALDPFHEKARAALKQFKSATNGAPPVVDQAAPAVNPPINAPAHVLKVPVSAAIPPVTDESISVPDKMSSNPASVKPEIRTARPATSMADTATTDPEMPDSSYPLATITDRLTPFERMGVPESIIEQLKSAEVDQSVDEWKKVQAPVELRVLPVFSGVAVAQLSGGTQVIPFQRTQDMDWVRVIYQSSFGIKDGWVPVASLDQITINGSLVPLIELPIVDYADKSFGYSRQQVQEILTFKKKQKEGVRIAINSSSNLGGCAGLLGMLCLGGMIVGLNALSYPISRFYTESTRNNNLALGIVSLLLFVGIIIFSFRVIGPKSKEERKYMPMHTWLIAQVKAFDTIQQNLRSDYEVMRDDQRRDAAIGFAANLGATLLNTAASRYIPNRQKVTIERK
jgi:hypothetical protein